jgi:drug/metabolite transporter (DMT)-like permease
MARADGYWAVFSAVCLLAINEVLYKTIPLDAVTITWLRCLIAFIALSIVAQIQNTLWLYSCLELLLLGGLGALMGLHWSCFFKVCKYPQLQLVFWPITQPR